MGTDRLGYRPQLDGLRGAAVLAVMTHHTGSFLLPDTERWLIPGGFLGVDLFLVLSGFLITRLLIERHAHGETTPGRFYSRRFRRLLPAATVLIIATIVFTAVAYPWRLRIAVLEGAAAATYVANYVRTWGLLGHMWSLAIEEQFYLVWPPILLVSLHRRVPLRHVAAGLATTVVVVAAWRAAVFDPADVWATYKRTDTRADALAIGCLLALVWGQVARWRWQVTGPTVAMAVAVTTVSIHSAALHRAGFTVIALVCAFAVGAAASGRMRWAGAPWLVTVGKWSYSLYLWHYPVFNVVGDRGAGGVSAAWGLSFVLAYGSWRWIEQPFRSRDREPVLVGDVGLDRVPVG